jgi:hypothetical protein
MSTSCSLSSESLAGALWTCSQSGFSLRTAMPFSRLWMSSSVSSCGPDFLGGLGEGRPEPPRSQILPTPIKKTMQISASVTPTPTWICFLRSLQKEPNWLRESSSSLSLGSDNASTKSRMDSKGSASPFPRALSRVFLSQGGIDADGQISRHLRSRRAKHMMSTASSSSVSKPSPRIPKSSTTGEPECRKKTLVSLRLPWPSP